MSDSSSIPTYPGVIFLNFLIVVAAVVLERPQKHLPDLLVFGPFVEFEVLYIKIEFAYIL